MTEDGKKEQGLKITYYQKYRMIKKRDPREKFNRVWCLERKNEQNFSGSCT